VEPGEWDIKSIAFDADINEQDVKKAVTRLIRRGYIRAFTTGKLGPLAMGVFYAWQVQRAYTKGKRPKVPNLPKLLVIWSLAHGGRTIAEIVSDTELCDDTVRQSVQMLARWGAVAKCGIYWRLACDLENEYEPKV
jgi:hypothetical protein